jgi:hypothetical protein
VDRCPGVKISIHFSIVFLVALTLLLVGWAEAPPAVSSRYSDPRDVPDMPRMNDLGGVLSVRTAKSVMEAMSHSLDIGTHMRMTALRTETRGDTERAAKIAAAGH